MNAGSAIPALAVAAKRRRLIESFRRAGAVSPETARTLEDVGVSDSGMLRRLQSAGIVAPLGDGTRFYLDEEASRADERMRMRLMVSVVAIIVVVIVYVLLTKR